ncbi:MAG: PIN domain-containing protein [Methanophagales archaeon]|nr:PIN domain-containing protein [Methanophagales archaeon]
MKLTIDSDVLAYAFIEPTKKVYKERFDEFTVLHNKADYLYKCVIRGVHELIIPATVLIEVAIVMSRTVGEETAKSVYEKVKRHASKILYLNEKFTSYCMEKGIKTHLSGFDTVVFACVVHANSALVTNDRSFFRNVKKHHPEITAYLLREMDVDEIY